MVIDKNGRYGLRQSFGALILLLIRSVLLWILLPLETCLWLALSPWAYRRGVGPGEFLGWADLNLIAFLQRLILRPLFPERQPWVPVHAMPEITHRPQPLDLF